MSTSTRVHHEARPPGQADRVWRGALVLSGILVLAGGPMHPSSPPELSLRDELALMADDDAWVPSHGLLFVAAALLAFGLWRVSRAGAWPRRTATAVRIAAVTATLYAIESFVHLLVFIDVDRLRGGEFAPVAFTHLGLGVVIYPLAGLSLAFLAWRLLPSWTVPQRPFAAVGVIGGIATAVALPATLAFGDTELSFLFSIAGVATAVWSIAAGLVGVRSAGPADGISSASVAARTHEEVAS